MNEEIKGKIRDLLAESLAAQGLEARKEDIGLEHPMEMAHGDYSSNAALVLAKKAGKNPKEIASATAESVRASLSAAAAKGEKPDIEKVEVAGPGFINFYLSAAFFEKGIAEILAGKSKPSNPELAGKKVMIEYTNPNPFKEFHIGHLMNNTIGEALSRIIAGNGAKLIRANYQGDVGPHVAKTIWALMQQKVTTVKDTAELGAAYAAGSQAYEENPEAKKEIVAINKKVYEGSDAAVNSLYEQGRKISLDGFEKIYEKLGTKFDHYFFESKTWKPGKAIVEKHLADGIFEKSEGAVIYPGEKHGLHTRVFINSEGIPTYEAKELGLNQEKFAAVPDLDLSLIVAANEQNGYFQVVLRALSEIFPEIAKRTRHLSYGMLRFASGKMSSRKGNVISAEALIADIQKLVDEKIRDRELTDGEKARISQAVAIAAIKYSILKQSVGKDIVFDLEKSISFEGDSGPYLQYAHTRALSVLEKASREKIAANPHAGNDALSTIEKLLCRCAEIAEYASEELAPNLLLTYLTELAGAFNGYYAQNKIVDATDPNAPRRVAITAAFAAVMRNGLSLLAIEPLEKM